MKKLNRTQQAAALPAEGPCIVLAGPGTGKTRTLIERIKNTVNRYKVNPENLLILTFSRKAADEIRERLVREGDKTMSAVFSGTFHSFSLRLLMENSGLYLGQKGMKKFPGVLDREKEEVEMRRIFMTRCASFRGMPCDTALKLMRISRALPAGIQNRLDRSGLSAELDSLKKEYASYKAEHCLIDYDDMTEHAIALLESYPGTAVRVRKQCRFIFVDEFQDTSAGDFRLLTLIGGREGNIFMVGDDYQSIYRFRGARVEYIINARKFFPGAGTHKLTVNYRSNSEIVRMSNSFISRNRVRSKKVIISARGGGGAIRFHCAADAGDEAGIIGRVLNEKRDNLSCAVLYRNNYQGETILRLLPGADLKASLLTMHGSKGLEFDTVIIAGVADSIIPDRETHIEDERRLFYVALTRAKSELHIIYRKNTRGELPRFVRECGYKGGR